MHAWLRQAFSAAPAVAGFIEVGAGGGALAASVAAEMFAHAHIVACDLRATRGLLDPRIRSVGGAAIESLPFATASFDLYAGIFAVEYARPAAAAAEMVRVLRPGGRVCLLMHHPDSYRASMLAPRAACIEAGLTVRALVRAEGMARSLRRRRLERCLKALDRQIAETAGGGDVVADLRDLRAIAAAHVAGVVARAVRVEQIGFLDSCAAAAMLVRAQSAATWALDGLRDFTRLLNEAGLEHVTTGILRSGGRPLAWSLQATRATRAISLSA